MESQGWCAHFLKRVAGLSRGKKVRTPPSHLIAPCRKLFFPLPYPYLYMHEMPKAYEPQQFEDDTYARWEQSGAFIPENLSDFETREPYTIVVPPPNATGTLHIGHATMLAIEDSLIRYQHMNDKHTLS